MSKSAAKRSKAWTSKDVQHLSELAKSNAPTRVIGLKMGRTEDAVRTKARADGVHLRATNQGGHQGSYVSGRVPREYERLVIKQANAARTSKSNLVARYVMEKSLETEFPGISFRDSLAGREAYLTGHRVAVWEVLDVYGELKSIEQTAEHFRWAPVLVRRVLAYAKAFPEEIERSREEERHGSPSLPVAG